MENAGTAISRLEEKNTGILDSTRNRALTVAGIACFALLTWAGARLAVPVPGTPVPGTLQTLSVLMAGLFLGSRAGSMSQALYVMAGLAGLPVFALPGAGPGYLLGPTGGYLLGFIVAPIVVGTITSRPNGSGLATRFAGLVLGSAALHVCGLAWLFTLSGGDAMAAFMAGVVPFALFDGAKIVLALGIHSAWCTTARRIRSSWSRPSAP